MKTHFITLKGATFLCVSTCLSTIFVSAAMASDLSIYEPSLVPSNPQVGECYARVLIPDQFSTRSKKVMTAEAYSAVDVDQPRLESRSEQVETKAAHIRFEVRQPSFKNVTERMLVRPSYEKLSVIPPQFTTVRETIATSAPRRVWKLGNPGALAAKGYRVVGTADAGRGGRGYRSTIDYGAAQTDATKCGVGCEIWCLVEIPGESVSFDRKVMSTPGTVRRTPVPAKYTSIRKQIVSDPGGVREIPVPAQYRSVQVEHVVDPGGERLVNVPAKYGNIQTKVLTASQRYEWRRVVCDPAKGRASRYGNTSGAYIAPSYSGQSYSGTSYGSGHHSGTGAVRSGGGYSSSTATTGSTSYAPSTSYPTGSTHSYSGSTYSQTPSPYGSSTSTSKTITSETTHSQAPVKSGVYYYGTDKPVD